MKTFKQYFALDLATTREQLEAVHRIRYRVYCEEFGFEPKSRFPRGLEVDEFDAYSQHCLITHVASGLPAATVRLVTVDEHTLMPMEKYCQEALGDEFHRLVSGERNQICEFSRLAVDSAFRRRAGERETGIGEISALDITNSERRTFSLIGVTAFTAAFALSDVLGRKRLFAMMAPFLPRMLRRSGINLRRVGEEVEYHGPRAPYFITTDEAAAGMHPDIRSVYEDIRASFAESVSAAERSEVKEQVALGAVKA